MIQRRLPISVGGPAHEIAELDHARTEELIGVRSRMRMHDRARERCGDVADVDRRELRVRARERQHGRHAQQTREAEEKAVAGTENHRRPEDRPCEPRAFHARFGFAARLQVEAVAFAGAQRAHLQQARDAGCAARCDQRFGQLDVRLAKAAAVVAALVEDADEIDRRVGARELARSTSRS